MKKYSLFLPVLLLSVIFFTSCNDDGCTDPAAANFDANADKDDGTCVYNTLSSLGIFVGHKVDGEELVQNDMIYLNAAGNEYSISRLRYYISDITLYEESGDSVFIPYYKYIDAFEQQTLSFDVIDHLPEGTYKFIKFNFGLTPRLNHLDSLPNTEPHASFTWPHMMGGGYHFMQMEGSYRHSATESRFYNTHLGHLNTSTADVDPHFSVSRSLPGPIISTVGSSAPNYVIHIDADLNEWYTNPNSYNFADYDSGIMGNAEAQQLLKENGSSVFSIKDIIIFE